MTPTEERDLRLALARAAGGREQARARVARAQAARDDMPPRPDDAAAGAAWDLALDGAVAELEAARAALQAAEADVRAAKLAVDALNTPAAQAEARELATQAQAERAAQAPARGALPDLRVGDTLAGMLARAAELETAVATLPCTPQRRTAEAAQAAGDSSGHARALVMAARACDAVRAHEGCAFAEAKWCPRAGAEALYEQIATNLRDGRIPAKQRRLLSGHFGLRGVQRAPLDGKGFDAFAAAEAVYTRRAGKLATLAGDVLLRGDETILVLYGPTGRGKTVAGCYLIARWGGLYLTSYELAGVGIDPGVPTRAQLVAAPVLVIDQLGRQHRSAADYAHATLEWISDRRHAEERLLVLIGNYETADQFAEDVDGVIASRVAGDGVLVQCYGDDARAQRHGAPGAGRR